MAGEDPTSTAAATTGPGPPAIARRSGAEEGDAAPTSSSFPVVGWSVATGALVLLGGAGFGAHRARRRRGLGAPVATASVVSAAGAVRVADEEVVVEVVVVVEAEPGDAARDVPVLADRPAGLTTDVVRTMSVLEPVLRAAVRQDVTFLVDSTTDAVMAAVGPHELESVVVPLVDRAAASLGDGGTIRVIVGCGPCPAAPDVEWALVVVADTGPRLTPENRPERRATTRPGRSNDGRSDAVDVVAAAVEALGGHLDVTEVARHGATVTVALPLAEAARPGAQGEDTAVSLV